MEALLLYSISYLLRNSRSLFSFDCAARHILCEKQGKINEAYKKLQDGWLSNGDKVPPAEFAKVNIYGFRNFRRYLRRKLIILSGIQLNIRSGY